LEKVYENGLALRLRKTGLKVEQQRPVRVYDEDGTLLGDYFVDLFVENSLIVELKACKILSDDHIAQVLGYLRATDYRDALLINFGSPKIQIRKFILFLKRQYGRIRHKKTQNLKFSTKKYFINHFVHFVAEIISTK
jgi:GxxExxY protein